MLLAGKMTDGKSFRTELLRDWAGPAIKRLIQMLIKKDGSKADHGKIRRNRTISLDVNDHKTHNLNFFSICSATNLWPVSVQ